MLYIRKRESFMAILFNLALKCSIVETQIYQKIYAGAHVYWIET